jgi:hypothetical protein
MDEYHNIELSNLTTGERKNVEFCDDGLPKHAILSPDTRFLLTIDRSRTTLYETATGIQKMVWEKQDWEYDHVREDIVFSHDSSYIWTGRYALDITQATESIYRQEEQDVIVVDNEWLRWNGERLLWLGNQSGLAKWAIGQNLLALGHSTGRVSLLRLRRCNYMSWSIS